MSHTIFSQFTEIKKQIIQHGGFLPVTTVQQLLSDFACTSDDLVQTLLPLAAEFSVHPISKFKVGAISVGDSGNLYFGANQEFAGVPISQVVHAEQAAIACAHLHGETGITMIAASERPCGHCRQFLYELADAHQLTVMLPNGHLIKLSTLLPDAFGPAQLGVTGGLLSASQPLQLTSANNDALVQQALAAASRSYAPYSKSQCGVALSTKDGKIFHGSYLENAAFNPTLPALQSALVHLMQSGARYEDVRDVVLVQANDGAVDHAKATELLLQAVCPAASLRVCGA
jgi:cytidine deaminase